MCKNCGERRDWCQEPSHLEMIWKSKSFGETRAILRQECKFSLDFEVLFNTFPGGSDGKESPCNSGDPDWIPESERFTRRREQLPTAVFLPGESPWTEEPGRLQSMGSQRVRHDWATNNTFNSELVLSQMGCLAAHSLSTVNVLIF